MRTHGTTGTILILSIVLLTGIAVGTLPALQAQSQSASDTQNASSVVAQSQSSSDVQSQSSSDVQSQPAAQPEIIPEDHIDVPEQTVVLGGNTYETKLIGRAKAGESFTVNVEGPGNSEYATALVDPRGPPSDVSPAKPARGNSRPSFATSGTPPGMYLAAVRSQGRTQTVMPIIVSAAETSLSGPDCVGVGTSATFEVYVNEDQAGDLGQVELVAFNQDRTIRITAERERENLYRAELPLDDVPQSDTKMLVHAKAYRPGSSGNGPGNSGNGPGSSPNLRNTIGITQQHTLFVVEDEANCG